MTHQRNKSSTNDVIHSNCSFGIGFCENCNTWFIGEHVARISIDNAAMLVDAIKSADFKIPQDMQPIITHPHLIVSFRHCPTCETNPEILTIEVAWKEDRENAVEQKSTWLNTILPPEHGKSMQNQLTRIPQTEFSKE